VLGSTLTATIGLLLALQPGQAGGRPDQPSAPVAPGKAGPAPVVITIGQTVKLRMSSKRPITSVFVDREGIVQVQADPTDQTTIRVTGLAAGVARIHLTDDGGKTEVHQWGRTR
jgi:hypothetical protein